MLEKAATPEGISRTEVETMVAAARKEADAAVRAELRYSEELAAAVRDGGGAGVVAGGCRGEDT